MVRSGNSEHVRFRYGMCLNDNCSKCKSKEVQQISVRKEFVCEECGKPLRECPPPKESKKGKMIVIAVATIVVIAAGVIFIPKLMNQPKEEPQIEVTEGTGNTLVVIDSVKTQEAELEGTEQKDVKTSTQETDEKPVKPTPSQVKDGYGTVNLGYGVYTGDLKNGKPHGHGRIKYSQRHKIVNSKDFVANPGDEFEGDFRDGRVSGGIGYWYHDGDQTAIKP